MFNKLFSFFSKKSGVVRTDNFDLLGLTFLDGYGSTFKDIRPALAWSYYKQISAIYRACNLISQEFNTIPIVLKNRKTEDVVRTRIPSLPVSNILSILQKPNYDKTGMEFNKANCISYLVTGETYIMMLGVTDLQEISFVNPADVIVKIGKDGYPDSFHYNTPYYSIRFNRNEEYRFFTQDGTKELYQMLDFNPRAVQEHRGYSRLSSVFYEMEEHINGNIHNTNTLKKGARPSGIVTVDTSLTGPQKEEIKKQISRFYGGAENTGNVMVFDNSKKFTELSITNKDMEFSKLSEIAKQSIYECLEIPASFYDNSKSSYNNKMNDRINLYIFAVLPIARRLLEEYTNGMLKRYKNSDDWYLTFIDKEIPALEPLFDESNLKKSQSGVFTINELREKYGLDSYGAAGDVLYQPAQEVPVGEGIYNAEELKLFEEIEKKYSQDEAERVRRVIQKSKS